MINGKNFKAIILICLSISFGSYKTNAQATLIQSAVSKLERSGNFSYQYTLKLRQYNTDTATIYHKDVFSRDHNDKIVGYRYLMETRNESDKSHVLETYNGGELIRLNKRDSTYQVEKASASSIQGSLLGYLRMLKTLAEKKPVIATRDTTINALTYARFTINTYDTVINHQHYYTRINLLMDKTTELPVRIVTISRNRNTADAVTNYYSSFDYSAYHLDQENIDSAFSTDITGYRLPVEKPTLPLLGPGSPAPDGTLLDIGNKQLKLSALRGKVVLLNFFFIGCEGGMISLKPLKNLYSKYEKKNFTVLSISDRDSRQTVSNFKNSYQIPFSIYGDAKGAFDAYHVSVSPTFYFIGKDGKIAQVLEGYDDSFETEATEFIDCLLRTKAKAQIADPNH